MVIAASSCYLSKAVQKDKRRKELLETGMQAFGGAIGESNRRRFRYGSPLNSRKRRTVRIVCIRFVVHW